MTGIGDLIFQMKTTRLDDRAEMALTLLGLIRAAAGVLLMSSPFIPAGSAWMNVFQCKRLPGS